MRKENTFPSATGTGEICVSTWIPDTGAVRGVLQITHGMAEHIQRYAPFAQFLNEHGYVVVGQDQAGHGRSVIEGGIYGYFGEANGWTALVEDMRDVYRQTKAAYPDVPYVLMGHSMGSFLARTYAARYGEDMDAFIFSGTAGKNPALPIAKLIAAWQCRKNAKAPSKTLDSLAFGAYAKAVPNAKTAFDWLSHDEAVVDAYVKDPECGFVFTAAAFRDLFDGLMEISAKDWPEKVALKPILILSGAEDPVGGNGKGVQEVADTLIRAGRDVELKLYAGGRHEMLNELERQAVYQDILAFLDKVVQSAV